MRLLLTPACVYALYVDNKDTDFSSMLARPKLMLLGAAAQMGIYFTLLIPIIQLPIMRLITTEAERRIHMSDEGRIVSKR